MKCENCGKNEVTFIYQSNINGQFTEKHLCSECAEKLGLSRKVMRYTGGLLPGLFNDDPFEEMLPVNSIIAAFRRASRMLEDPFDDLFAGMPALGTPEALQEPKQEPLLNQDDENEFAKSRRLNALRVEMQQAVQQENFERAAELRDQIRALEAENQ
ncbi:MAG: hypothetical protein HFF89_01750 [Oscillibacter sp.]|jgi:protein arginine kinase activator|nr:hypothetical protein [Oscillibacter sp.]MCI8847977.1 hypothetical protein [Oscillibacter sp.]MCI9376195.1 hypothetical protein [Oscillibacter sp.]